MSFGTVKVEIAGNCVADPVLRFTQEGLPIAKVSVAVDFPIKDADGGKVAGPVQYYPVTVWGPQAANLVESARQGTRIEVRGRLVASQFTATRGAHEGEVMTNVEVAAESVSISLQNQTMQPQKVGGPREPAGIV